MTTESMILGLEDIIAGRIIPEALIDMAPELIEHLSLLIVQKALMEKVGNDYVYIAGKVTGLRRWDVIPKFKRAETVLMAMGYKVINPMEIVPVTCTWSNAMRTCIIEMMKHCNKIYLLDNWHDSEGARIEKSLADMMHFEHIVNMDTLKIAI